MKSTYLCTLSSSCGGLAVDGLGWASEGVAGSVPWGGASAVVAAAAPAPSLPLLSLGGAGVGGLAGTPNCC